MSDVKRVMGIDPGSRIAGYGIVEESGRRLAAVGHGAVRAPETSDANQKLKYIFEAFSEIIAQYNPNEMAIETVFFAQNARSALVLGQARAAAILPAMLAGIPVYEYSALQVKKALTGGGKAEKKQVADMTCRILGLKVTPKPEDVTDALALAVCHINSSPILRKLGKI
ncbi:MAG: crossover junction endodeoxyribonuclease RuvC [Nitrospinae bacterium]|nr:crossover junction endodeoxyribonuclease RuvC [Nitrospinota bacterium]